MAEAKANTPARARGPQRKLFTATDVANLPPIYASICEGTCMLPLISDGAKVVFDRSAKCKPGDIVSVIAHPRIVKPGGHQSLVKRLLLGIPSWVDKLPYQMHPDSTVEPIVMLEQLNPGGTITIPLSDVLAIIRAVGTLHEDGRTIVPFPKLSRREEVRHAS